MKSNILQIKRKLIFKQRTLKVCKGNGLSKNYLRLTTWKIIWKMQNTRTIEKITSSLTNKWKILLNFKTSWRRLSYHLFPQSNKHSKMKKSWEKLLRNKLKKFQFKLKRFKFKLRELNFMLKKTNSKDWKLNHKLKELKDNLTRSIKLLKWAMIKMRKFKNDSRHWKRSLELYNCNKNDLFIFILFNDVFN